MYLVPVYFVLLLHTSAWLSRYRLSNLDLNRLELQLLDLLLHILDLLCSRLLYHRIMRSIFHFHSIILNS